MTGNELTVLSIDDDSMQAEMLRRLLAEIETMEITFVHAADVEKARIILARESIDLAFIDYRLGTQSGLELLIELRASNDLRPLIFITGEGGEQIATSALHAGADDYLSKSELSPERLGRAISISIANSQNRLIEKQNRQLLKEVQSKNEMLESKGRHITELYETAQQFVNDVSHEFRTPLTVIKEFTSIIKDGLAGKVNDEQDEYLGIVLDRVDDLSTLIEDMLDLSRLEAGQLGVRRKECLLEGIVQHIRSTLDQKAALRKMKLSFDLPADLAPVYCDPEKIGRIIINLCVNAVKFSLDESEIELSARHDPAKAEVRIVIRDQGPGIPEESLKLLFERFSQVGSLNKTAIKGFGLGLNICKELIHLNFGEIGVDSQVGKGSAFWFTVPTADPLPLIRRYTKRIAVFQQDAEFASIVTARISPDASELMKEATERFLHQHIRRSDLIIGIKPHLWMIVLASNGTDVDSILVRNQDAWVEANRNNPLSPLIPIDFHKQGTWKLGERSEEFARSFERACLNGKASHA